MSVAIPLAAKHLGQVTSTFRIYREQNKASFNRFEARFSYRPKSRYLQYHQPVNEDPAAARVSECSARVVYQVAPTIAL